MKQQKLALFALLFIALSAIGGYLSLSGGTLSGRLFGPWARFRYIEGTVIDAGVYLCNGQPCFLNDGGLGGNFVDLVNAQSVAGVKTWDNMGNFPNGLDAGAYIIAHGMQAGFVDAGIEHAIGITAGFVDGGVIACAAGANICASGVCSPAAQTASGCVNTATQTFGGYKIFATGGESDDVWQNTANFSRNLTTHTIGVSEINYNGLMIGGTDSSPLAPVLDDSPLTLESRRLPMNVGNGVVVRSAYFRDAGGYFTVNSGIPCDQPIFSVNNRGDITFQPSTEPDCTASPDILQKGIITDGTSASGHVSLQSYDKLYLTLQGRLSTNHTGLLLDGGHPLYDGGTWVIIDDGGTYSDGGTYYAYAGLHGNVTVQPVTEMQQGLLFEIHNPVSVLPGSVARAGFDVNGGYCQVSGITRAQFPPCPGTAVQVSIGQFTFDARLSTQMYAADEDRWYFCTATGWSAVMDARQSTRTQLLTQLNDFVLESISSNLNGIASGTTQSITAQYMTGGVNSVGLGTGVASVACIGTKSGKVCGASISCTDPALDGGGAFFTVPMFAYSGAGACTFTNEHVYCRGQASNIDAGTTCTVANFPSITDVRIEGTLP